MHWKFSIISYSPQKIAVLWCESTCPQSKIYSLGFVLTHVYASDDIPYIYIYIWFFAKSSLTGFPLYSHFCLFYNFVSLLFYNSDVRGICVLCSNLKIFIYSLLTVILLWHSHIVLLNINYFYPKQLRNWLTDISTFNVTVYKHICNSS